MADQMLTGAQIVLRALKDQGADVIFGLPGGVTLSLYDEIFKQNELRHILVRHEQGAVHAAEGFARSTGKVGVALVTSGPGATNTVTGLVDAMMDSIPLVCLTGQVPTALIGNDAFQEADTTGITRQCTKHNYLVKDVADLARILHEAFYVARSGRPGPVLVDLPKDVILAHGQYVSPAKVVHKTYKPKIKAELPGIKEAVRMIAAAKRPILYCGGGVINSGPEASQLLAKFAHTTGIPVTLTLMGLGAFPASDKQFLGMLGMHGTYEANMAMYECDLMVNLGARFDDRVTGRLSDFAPNARKIHVDIDPSSINKNVVVDLPLVGDCGHVLEDLIKVWKSSQASLNDKAMKAWWKRIDGWRERRCLDYAKSDTVIKPQYAIERIRDLAADKDAYFTTDVGQHQMWSAQFLRFDKPNRWMTSGGLGTMGYGVPAAMGAQMAHPDSLVVCVSGEGSFMMNVQELATMVQYKMPVKVFVLNNGFLGMVRQWQEMFHGERYSESRLDTHPDFVKLAEAFGMLGLRATKPGEVDEVIAKAYAHDGPVLVDMHVDATENVFPMIPAGAAHNEMLMGPSDEGAVGDSDSDDVVLA